MSTKPTLTGEEIFSNREQRWFPVAYLLPDDDTYIAVVWDERHRDTFAISRENVTQPPRTTNPTP